jgi:sigma-E factor negative regulatory protein RseB
MTALALLASASVRAQSATPAPATLAPTQTPAAPTSAPALGDARQWLQRMHEAALALNYQGTMVLSASGTVQSMRVAHYCVGRDSFEHVEHLSGRMQRSFRHNDVVHTLWPQERRAVVEPRSAFTPVALPATPAEPRVEEHYEWRSLGADRVAGRDARVFRLQPKDQWRFAQRIWADQATGLLLRSDVLGTGDELLETSAFTEINFDVKAQPERVLKAMRQLEGYEIERPQQRLARLADEGWQLDDGVPGFRLSSCVKRAWAWRDDAGRQQEVQVLQAVFTDGLTHVSLFIEPFDASRHKAPMQTRMGATHTLMQRHGQKWWLTAMGDVPVPSLQRFAQALKRRP